MGSSVWTLVSAVLVLLLSGIQTGRAQTCNVTLFQDEGFSEPYDLPPDTSVEDGARICALVLIDTTGAPYPCYEVTLTRVVICSGTAEELLPFGASGPGNTGCHTPISSGIVRTNTVYDSSLPNNVLASYNPNFELVDTSAQPNVIKFCYNSKQITGFNNVIEVEWAFNCSCRDNCGVCGGNNSTCATTAPATTTPPPGTTGPTTTPPPTTAAPTNGTAKCGSIYDLYCPVGQTFTEFVGCLPPPPRNSPVPIILGAVGGALALLGLLTLLFRRRITPADVKQTVVVDIDAEDVGGLLDNFDGGLGSDNKPRRISEKRE